MPARPVFIHSLFRTGSTYVWNKFRQNSQYYCFYEPFHQDLALMSVEHPVIWLYDKTATDKMGHPELDKDHLYEYRKFQQDGSKALPLFKKSFGFDEFFNNDKNPDLKRYIDYLIKLADDKIPVFKFCRTAHRAHWFKTNYPGSLNIYIFRNPRNQWQSYFQMYTRYNRLIFQVMDLILVSKNMNLSPLAGIKNAIPLFVYHSEKFKDEELIYSQLIDAYSSEEKYFIFYFIWFKSFLENVLKTDLLISIDRLSVDEAYRREIHELLLAEDVTGIDFSDSKIKNYTNYAIEIEKMKAIEMQVQHSILQTLNHEQVQRFASLVSTPGLDFLEIDEDIIFSRNNPLEIKDHTWNTGKMIPKYEIMFKALTDFCISQRDLIEDAKQKVLKITTDRENAIKQYQITVKKREHKIDQLSKELSRTKETLGKNEEMLKDRDHKIDQLSQELSRAKNALEKYKEALKNRDYKINQLLNEVSHKNEIPVGKGA